MASQRSSRPSWSVALLVLSFGVTFACDWSRTYADASSEYSVVCNPPPARNVHLAVLSGDGGWAPLDAPFVNGTNNIIANFSNAKAPLTGTISEKDISWSNGAVWRRATPTADVRKVHLVYMTHLDLGFTNTTRGVCDTYFDDYFPAAFATAAALRTRGGPERFRWTEFTWLLQEYLDGGAGCAHRDRTAAEVA